MTPALLLELGKTSKCNFNIQALEQRETCILRPAPVKCRAEWRDAARKLSAPPKMKSRTQSHVLPLVSGCSSPLHAAGTHFKYQGYDLLFIVANKRAPLWSCFYNGKTKNQLGPRIYSPSSADKSTRAVLQITHKAKEVC